MAVHIGELHSEVTQRGAEGVPTGEHVEPPRLRGEIGQTIRLACERAHRLEAVDRDD